MASFQTKIGWKRLRNRENKNYRSIMFLPNRLEKIQKITKKFKKYNYCVISSQNRLENTEKGKKSKLPLYSVPSQRVRRNYKKLAKTFKKFNKTVVGFI